MPNALTNFHSSPFAHNLVALNSSGDKEVSPPAVVLKNSLQKDIIVDLSSN